MSDVIKELNKKCERRQKLDKFTNLEVIQTIAANSR